MLRRILGLIAGIAVTAILVAVVESLGHLVYPPPEGIDLTDPESLKAYMSDAPIGALLSVLLAWAVGTMAGSGLAGVIAGEKECLLGTILGALFLIGGIVNMAMIPHPLWFWIAGVLVFPLAAFMGIREATAVNRKRAPAQVA